MTKLTRTSANGELLGAFKERITADLNPVVSLKFGYAIHDSQTEQTLTGSGTATATDGLLVLSTTAASSSSATLASHDTIVYQPGQGVLARFTALFTTGATGSKQLAGIGTDNDGYFIGYNGTRFGVCRKYSGTETWTYLDEVGDGSDDTLGRLDPTKGNIYQIQYQWLGFGPIAYYVYDAFQDTYVLLYLDRYPNENTQTSSRNPNFRLYYKVENTTNTSNIVLKSGSGGLFIEGRATNDLDLHSISNEKTITTEVNVLTIKMRSTYHSIENRSVVFPRWISVAAAGTKTVTFRVYLDPTVGGSPSFTNVDTNDSLIEYDTAGTTVTGGTKVLTFVVSKDGSQVFDLNRLIRLHQPERMVVTAQSTASSDVVVALTWEELQ
jgi:hypothetical protein